MKNIQYLESKDLLLLNNFIFHEQVEFNKFAKLGWTKENIKNHLKKENNYSIALINENKIYGFLLGEKILNTNNFDLEIHIMFVSKKMRRNNIGSSLLNFIETNRKKTNISKIYLEVSENNLEAIKFYEKNNFVFFKFRHNYYKDINKKNSARCYSKII